MSKSYTSAAPMHPALRDNPELLRQIIRSVLAGREAKFTWRGNEYVVRTTHSRSEGRS